MIIPRPLNVFIKTLRSLSRKYTVQLHMHRKFQNTRTCISLIHHQFKHGKYRESQCFVFWQKLTSSADGAGLLPAALRRRRRGHPLHTSRVIPPVPSSDPPTLMGLGLGRAPASLRTYFRAASLSLTLSFHDDRFPQRGQEIGLRRLFWPRLRGRGERRRGGPPGPSSRTPPALPSPLLASLAPGGPRGSFSQPF